MSWINKILSSTMPRRPAKPEHYPSRVYRKVLCSRQHCTGDCQRTLFEPYKFWMNALTSPMPDRKALLVNLSTMPESVRFGIYKQILARQCMDKALPRDGKYNRYFQKGPTGIEENEECKSATCTDDSKPCPSAETGPANSSTSGEQDQSPLSTSTSKGPEAALPSIDTEALYQSQDDCVLVHELFQLIGYFTYNSPEDAFRIYKALEEEYVVNRNLLKVILLLLSMHGSDEESTYRICYQLIRAHGLLDALGSVDESMSAEKMISPIIMAELARVEAMAKKGHEGSNEGAEESSMQEHEESSGKSNTREIIDSNIEGTVPILSEAKEETSVSKSKGKGTEATDKEEIVAKTLGVMLKYKIDAFSSMTDLVMALDCTYRELVIQAASFTQSEDPHELVAVLASRLNNEYYTDMLRAEKRPPIPRRSPGETATYFDYLVIQNEMIKAQENMRSDLILENADLREKNEALLMEQMALVTSLEKIKQNLKDDKN